MAVPIAMLCGAAIGLVSGLTGVGGGIFLSPLILFMHWAEARETAGISAAFILVNSIAGLLGLGWSRAHGISQIMWFLVPAALLGGILGSELGSRRLGNPSLRRLLALVLFVAGAKLALIR